MFTFLIQIIFNAASKFFLEFMTPSACNKKKQIVPSLNENTSQCVNVVNSLQSVFLEAGKILLIIFKLKVCISLYVSVWKTTYTRLYQSVLCQKR